MRGLVYTNDGRIVRRGIGLNQQDGLLLKLH